jgi:hypothetical protein
MPITRVVKTHDVPIFERFMQGVLSNTRSIYQEKTMDKSIKNTSITSKKMKPMKDVEI